MYLHLACGVSHPPKGPVELLYRWLVDPYDGRNIFRQRSTSPRYCTVEMASELRIVLVGDQDFGRLTYLRSQLLYGRASPILTSFFQRVNLALRKEVSHLSPLEAKNIPNFSTLEDLVERTHTTETYHVGVENALLCISQLAHYIE